MSTKKRGLEVLVGEPLPDGVEVRVGVPTPSKDPRDPRTIVMLGTALVLLLLLGVLTAYGWVHSESMLDRVFELVKYGLSLLWGFAFGQFTARVRSPGGG